MLPRIRQEAVHYTRAPLIDMFVLDPSDFDESATVASLFDVVTTWFNDGPFAWAAECPRTILMREHQRSLYQYHYCL